MRKSLLLIIILMLFPAIAFSLTIGAVDNWDVQKEELSGMEVTVGYSDNTSSDHIWNGTSGISTGDWSFQFTGANTNAGGANWVFDYNSGLAITSITIDAYGDADTGAHNFFDIVYDISNEYTPNSDQGLWYTTDGSTHLTAPPVIPSGSAKYFNDIAFGWAFTDPVLLAGDTIPYGDLYTTLTINFADPNGYMDVDKDFIFGIDTDREYVNAVPEPTTIMLFGLGLLGFSAVSRKKFMS